MQISRDGLRRILESRRFTGFITFVILLNALTLGLETKRDLTPEQHNWLVMFDHGILVIFVAELLLRLHAYRRSFFRSGWNIFDGLIILISILPLMESLSVLRTLRIFRVLRLFSVVPQMRKVVTALVSALPGMSSVVGILLVIFYINAVIATQFFGRSDDPDMIRLWGSLDVSLLHLFQLMTFDNWMEDLATPTMAIYPMSWIFFVPFVIIVSFSVMNLFIGIIVEAMNLVNERPAAAQKQAQADADKINHLLAELAEIKALLKQQQATPPRR